MKAKPLPSRKQLMKLFRYDAGAGILYRRPYVTAHGHHFPEKACLCVYKGYVMTSIKGIHYRVHRIVWKIIHGTEPAEIDHRNCNKVDNRQGNLRAATKSQNVINRPRRKRQEDLPRGVERRGNRFRARITTNKRTEFLGNYDTAARAHRAYRDAAQRLHGQFARFN